MTATHADLKFTDYAVVRASETDLRGVATPPALCNYLQETAGYHAEALGLGIDAMRARGVTWKMSGLHLDISYRAGAVRGDTVVSGAAAIDANTVAHRIHRAADNTTLAVARTAWAPPAEP